MPPVNHLEEKITQLTKMKSYKWEHEFLMTVSALIFMAIASALLIPEKMDGFVYNNDGKFEGSIKIEAFFDPVCPDSRDAWPPLKRALEHYGSRVSLTVHPFALPYHDNAFVACRALHVVNKCNASATFHTMELLFDHQEELYNQQTFKMSRETVMNRVSYYSAIATRNCDVKSSFSDRQTDHITRVSFKYGCSRGVFGTPFFFVNGFPLPDAGSALNYTSWRNIIDPLVHPENQMIGESLH